MRKSIRSEGFTLVELMVTIGVLAIILAIAVPSYQSIVQKSRRADAKTTLMGEAQRLERCFTDNDTYVGCNSYSPAIPSFKGYYDISGDQNTITPTTYTLTATAKYEQVNDTKCRTFTLNHLGAKTAADSNGNDTTTECWN